MWVADILSGCEFVHFLTRRHRLNRLGGVFAHDELDWLVHYVSAGLFFDHMFSDPNAPDFVRLLRYTEEIDNWYFAKAGLRTVSTDKPQRKRASNLRALVRRLRTERPRHFSLAGVLASDWSIDSEAAVSHQVDLARQRARTKGMSSISLHYPGYGFAWGINHRNPLETFAMASFLASKERPPDEARPMWIAVVESPEGHLGSPCIQPGTNYAQQSTAHSWSHRSNSVRSSQRSSGSARPDS